MLFALILEAESLKKGFFFRSKAVILSLQNAIGFSSMLVTFFTMPSPYLLCVVLYSDSKFYNVLYNLMSFSWSEFILLQPHCQPLRSFNLKYMVSDFLPAMIQFFNYPVFWVSLIVKPLDKTKNDFDVPVKIYLDIAESRNPISSFGSLTKWASVYILSQLHT